MRILGIDYGTRRIGLAVSDESLTLARELEILHPRKFWERLAGIVKDLEIGKIIVGLPLGVSGNETEKTKEVESFRLKVESATKLPVEFIDERFSTAMAKHLPGGNHSVDSLAAQIILQNYLDKNKNYQN